MRSAWQDVRYAVRLLRRSPAFAAIAVITLTAGIGANTAIFSVVRGVLLKPLPYPDPERLVRVFEERMPETPEFPYSPGNFVDYREQTRACESTAAYTRGDLQLGGDRPEPLRAMRVTAGYFGVLGYRPLLGRDFTRGDEAPGHDGVVVLSHALWVRRFSSNPSIVGATVMLSGRAFEVIGVLPPGVQHVGGNYRSHPHGESVDAWWPQPLPSAPKPFERQQHYLNVVGRLAPGVTLAQAQEDAREFSARLAGQYPKTNAGWSAHVRSLRTEIVGTTDTSLVALFAAAGAVLLIACLNVAGLLMGRATARAVEIGVRSALGATRARIVRQLVIESALLAGIGGALGIALAYGAVPVLRALAPADTPRLAMISVDRMVLVFAVTVSALTGLVFGLAPAVAIARADVAPALQGGRGAPGGARQRLRRTFVAGEIALAFVLVSTAGLLLRSFTSVLRVDPGFRAEHVLTARVNLPPARYDNGSAAAAAAFFSRLAARVQGLPAVRSAGIGSDMPWTGYDENTGFTIVGRSVPGAVEPEARYHFVTPGFTAALGLPLLAGRDVAAGDVAGAPPVVLINEATARQYWPDAASAVGATLQLWGDRRTIVGVIGAVKDMPWMTAQPGGVYFPVAQRWHPQDMVLAIRTDGDPQALVTPLLRIVRELDPELPLSSVQPLDTVVGAALAARRFTLILVALFGATALFLAIVGVYGVTAQAVSLRVREYGIRLALGARPADILRRVIANAAGVAAVGLAGGLAFALPTTRLARSLLFRISPGDPLTLTAVATVLLLATLAASWIPARRAMRTDPAAALRQE